MGVVAHQDRVEVVFRAVHARLWRSLLLSTGDPELASDAVAEAFAQALRRGPEIDDVEAWVWRAAFRIARGLAAVRSRSTELGSLDSSALPTGSLSEFLGLLSDLSPHQRECVALRYVGGYTSSEIGELLGMNASTVRVHLNRAHTALRERLREAERA